MEWINVNDRLPEIGQKVIVIQNPIKTATKEPLFSHYDNEGFRSYVESGYKTMLGYWIEITHWMPLPDPPKKE